MICSVQDEPIDNESLLETGNNEIGSVVTFRGIVRETENSKKLKGLYYESEKSLAREELERVIKETKEKFGVCDINAVHRVGMLNPGDISLLVVVFSTHRKEGFEACEYMVERIKERLPIWKKDIFLDETERWH